MVRALLLPAPACLLVLAVLIFTGCDKNAGAKPADPPRVTVARPLVRKLTDEVDYNGWLAPRATQEVRSRVRGHIKKIHFQDGDDVEKDQLLFELDPRPFQVEINQALANTEALKAQKVAAEKDVARYTELVKSGGATKQQLEKSEADVASYEAQVAAKLEEVHRHELDLEFAKITAELTGKISKANLREGNLINAGGSDPLLTTIVSTGPIHVYFSVDERALQDYGKSNPKKDAERSTPLRDLKVPFTFGLDTEEGFPHPGILDFADNKIEEGTGTGTVRGEAENPDGKLVPGSRVRVRVPISKPYDAIVTPDSAVLSDLDRKYLLVLDKEFKVLRRDITLGRLLDDGMRVILPAQGEEPGDEWRRRWEGEWIVTIGLQKARINYPVTPLDDQGEPITATTAAK